MMFLRRIFDDVPKEDLQISSSSSSSSPSSSLSSSSTRGQPAFAYCVVRVAGIDALRYAPHTQSLQSHRYEFCNTTQNNH
eukprot:12428376-Karenia_brevis.AAC.1